MPEVEFSGGGSGGGGGGSGTISLQPLYSFGEQVQQWMTSPAALGGILFLGYGAHRAKERSIYYGGLAAITIIEGVRTLLELTPLNPFLPVSTVETQHGAWIGPGVVWYVR